VKQTNATFLVDDGVLMADKDQVVSLVKARVIVEPIDRSSAYDAERRAEEAEKRAEETFRRMDRAGTRLMRWFLGSWVVYPLTEIIHAFAAHAFRGVGR